MPDLRAHLTRNTLSYSMENAVKPNFISSDDGAGSHIYRSEGLVLT